MILISHPTGNQNVRHAALALAEAGMLEEFWTCVNWNPGSLMSRILPRSLSEQMERRTFPESIRSKTHQTSIREFGRVIAQKLKFASVLQHETGFLSIDAIYRSFDATVAKRIREKQTLQAVYAYEDGAASSFAVAKQRGIKRIYDLPIGYYRAAREILGQEILLQPEWEATLTGTKDSAAKLARKDEELGLADTIIVASSFTRKTLEMAPHTTAPIHVIPYGAPAPLASCPLPGRAPLKVLFVGGLGQRKGISYLLDAMKQLTGKATLTLIGAKTSEDCKPLNDAVRTHRWLPSLPHAEVLREMERHDVFVFPSLFEGFGLVLLEAMSRGLPVIATPNTAAPDIIEDGRDGYLVPLRSTAAITEKLDLLASNSDLLYGMKHAALQTARRHTWENYRMALAGVVANSVGGNSSR